MDMTALTNYLDSLKDVGVPGCDMVIWKDHEEIYRHRAGFRDAEGKVPMNGEETYFLYSCSKVVTSCAAMQLLERGLIDLDDPVAKYLPAYGELYVRTGAAADLAVGTACPAVRPAKKAMTIRHLLSMQGGMDYELETPAIQAVLKETGGQATTRQLVDAMAKAPLMFEPGTDFLYSLCHDVIGAVIEVVSGMTFSEYLQQNIFDPLGLETIGFSLKEKMRGGCAPSLKWMMRHRKCASFRKGRTASA